MACPFFLPITRADDIAFPHPARLPLGASWRGLCSAPGHEQTVLSCIELEACNLGYAKSCSRLPKNRLCDAVRFAVVNDSASRISVKFVFEMNHLPGEHGLLEYDRLSNQWASAHPDPRIQKLAHCFLQSYLDRQNPIPTASA